MDDGSVLAPGEGKFVALPGATMVFKVLGGRPFGDYVVVEFTADPGFAGPRPHIHHTHEELFYVLDGEFDFLVGERSVRVGPGSFVNVPPGVVHDFRNPGSALARWLGTICPAGLEKYFDEIMSLVQEGRFGDAARRELRSRYDIVELDELPAGHWLAGP